MMNKYKYIGANVPAEVREALSTFVERFDLEYADNDRFTPMDDPEGMAQFEDIASTGCCGSFEHEVEDATGRKWLIGCNYGH